MLYLIWLNSIPLRHGDGAYYEHGPRTLRPSGVAGANTLELIEEIGLDVSLSIPCRVYVNGFEKIMSKIKWDFYLQGVQNF